MIVTMTEGHSHWNWYQIVDFSGDYHQKFEWNQFINIQRRCFCFKLMHDCDNDWRSQSLKLVSNCRLQWWLSSEVWMKSVHKLECKMTMKVFDTKTRTADAKMIHCHHSYRTSLHSSPSYNHIHQKHLRYFKPFYYRIFTKVLAFP